MARIPRKERQARARNQTCPMCGQLAPFLWTCPCGLAICDACMKRDLWGFTCNNITWVCPDCGRVRTY
jgi:hypothetical protein